MITKEQALKNVKRYLSDKKRDYIEIASLDKVMYEEQKEVPYGKYEEQIRNFFVIPYYIEGYFDPIVYFVAVDAETGEVLFTMTEHGYAEEWEED